MSWHKPGHELRLSATPWKLWCLCPWFPINAGKRCPLLFQHTLIMLPFQWYWIMMLTKFTPCLIQWQLTQESKHCVMCYINKIIYNIWTMTQAESCFINLLHRSQQDCLAPKLMVWICCFLPWSCLIQPALLAAALCRMSLRIGLLSPLIFV